MRTLTRHLSLLVLLFACASDTTPPQPTQPADRSVSSRMRIFRALADAEARAEAEAESLYPINPRNISLATLRSYDFSTALPNHFREVDRREDLYRENLLQEFDISEAELDSIGEEGVMKRWPPLEP